MINKSILKISIIAASLAACSSGSGGSGGGSNGGNGDASSLQIIAPKTIFSLPSVANNAYVVINNPTNTTVKNLTYSLANPIGSGQSAEIDPASAALCGVVESNSQCNLKLNIPAGAIAGSIGITAQNKSTSLAQKLKNLAIESAASNVITSGIEQAAYNSLTGADGITLSFYHTVLNGTSYILVSGLVASANAGSFNNVAIIDADGNPIANQKLIGSVSSAQGSTFSILLPVAAGLNINQVLKAQTQQVSTDGTVTVVSTATTANSLSTVSNIGIAEMLPSAVYLTAANPEQIVTFSNIGDVTAQLQQLVSTNPNIDLVFNPSSLVSGSITTATLKLKNPNAGSSSGSIALTYNNGQAQVTVEAKTDQNVDPAPTPSPTPTPTPTPVPPPTPTPTPTPPSLDGPSGITINNGYAYILDVNSDSYTQCTVDPTTGVFSACDTVLPTGSGTLFAPSGITINNGFAYITNNADDSYTKCTVNPTTGIFSACNTVTPSAPGGLDGPIGIAINNGFAYITNFNGNSYTKCTVDPTTGVLSTCNTLTPGALNTPAGIAINNGFAYITNFNGNSYTKCTVDPTTGVFSACNTVTPSSPNALGSPNGIAINNGFAYIANNNDNNYTQCTVDPTTGVLSACSTVMPAAPGALNGPNGIAINNGFAYITNNADDSYTKCVVNPTTGALSDCTTIGGS